MRGLLYKDLLALLRTKLLPIYLVAVVAMPLSSEQNMMMLFFPCFFAATLPMTLLSYDEKARWDRYLTALPVTRAQAVHAKYVMALALIGSFSLLATASKTVLAVCRGQQISLSTVGVFVMLVCVGMTMNAFIMPFIFKFGTEKGVLIYYVMLGFFGVAVGIFHGINGLDYALDVRISPFVTIVFAAIAAGVFALSWMLSVRFYTKREL